QHGAGLCRKSGAQAREGYPAGGRSGDGRRAREVIPAAMRPELRTSAVKEWVLMRARSCTRRGWRSSDTGHASLTSPAGAPGPPRAGQVASRSWQASPRPARNGSVGGFDGDADPELAARVVGHPGEEHVALVLVFDV